MATGENQATYKVTLRQRVVLADGCVYDAERELCLPIQPFVGLRLYRTEWSPPDWDGSEEPIEEIAYDLSTGRIFCYLSVVDFRPESSGSDNWTEEDVREKFRDWTLKRDETIRPEKSRKPTKGYEWN
jgi:hypothetical protein